MSEKENNIIPIERGLEIKDEERDELIKKNGGAYLLPKNSFS